MIFTQALVSLQKRFENDYELSSTIRHRGERGRQRENGLLTFLRETLPSAYGVGTGEILPYLGRSASPQCDVIIYDHLNMPILGKKNAVQQIPLEAVYAVIECKSQLDATALKDAASKFRKIRALPRCKSKRTLRPNASAGPMFFVFGYKFKTTPEACTDFSVKNSVDCDTNVCALDRGASVWIDAPGKKPYCVFLTATSTADNLHETLALFYVTLLEGLREIDLGSPGFIELFFNGE